MVLSDPVASSLPADAFGRASILSEARSIAQGLQDKGFQPASQPFVPLYKAALAHYQMLGTIATALLAFAGGAFAFTRIRPDFRARNRVETLVMWGLMLASLIAIITTLGILASLLFETYRFFALVSPLEFLTGTDWNPEGVRHSRCRKRLWGNPFILGDDLYRRDHRHAGGDSPWIDERDFPDAICQRPCAQLDEAGARNSRGHPDRGLRLFRRAHRRADGA